MKLAYPGPADITVRLASAGVPLAVIQSLDVTTAAARARTDFEGKTGHWILAQNQTRTFDPPRNANGIISLHYSLIALTSLAIGNATKILNTDFYMIPENADMDGRPWEAVQFENPFNSMFLQRKSISVTGLWGRYNPATGMEETAFDAMTARACWLLYPELALRVSGGMLGRTDGDTQRQFGRGVGTGPYAEEKNGWDAEYQAGVIHCLRTGIF